MHIPKIWSKAGDNVKGPDGRLLAVSVWGSGNDEFGARRDAAGRLKRQLERIRRGDPFPDNYEYAVRSIREEIRQTIPAEQEDDATPFAAIVTRNRYGALVLNTRSLLFLDIDLQPATAMQRLLGVFGVKSGRSEQEVLKKLRSTLGSYGKATFRLYRTAAGFRAIAIDREFDPAGQETKDLMQATGTDPAFSRLCVAQQCFRARLTPKPWRCHCDKPPNEHPRSDEKSRKEFAAWQQKYDKAIEAYASCRYLETIGQGGKGGNGEANDLVSKLLEIHDSISRCDTQLPLA